MTRLLDTPTVEAAAARHPSTSAQVIPSLQRIRTRADIAIVVTNGTFTRDARAWGDRHRVYWIDRDRLRQWAEAGVSLQQILRLPARGRSRQAASRPTT